MPAFFSHFMVEVRPQMLFLQSKSNHKLQVKGVFFTQCQQDSIFGPIFLSTQNRHWPELFLLRSASAVNYRMVEGWGNYLYVANK